MSADSPDDKGGKPGGFKVTDRRQFTEEPSPAPAPAETAQAAAVASPAAAPPIDFHTFVLSLGSSVLLHLGELERPGADGPETDLSMAKHTIDILGMLQDKTRGNLTPAEAKLIESLLYDLRLRYVEALKKKT
jgi:Domain of unknown function (DUF1844)